MKITKSQLKQIIKEELNHYMSTPSGDTPEDVARDLVASGVKITEQSIEQAVFDAGALDDDIPDFVDAVWNEIQSGQLQEIFGPGDISDKVADAHAFEDARAKVMTQLKALLSGPDAKAARITPEKIDRIVKGFWRVLVEESK